MARAPRRTRFGLPDVFLQEPKQREVLSSNGISSIIVRFSLFRMN